MICIYVARQRYDAYLVADRLNQAGIRAHVFNEHASSIAGDVPLDVAQPQVWLADDDDAPRALALLRSIEAESKRTPLYCRNCGEQSPGNFELCWNCGTAIA
jgi:putative signal transducing protein